MPADTKSPKPKTAWEMTVSILVGLHQAEAKAHTEFDAIRNANPGKPFAPGLGAANDLLNSISTAKKRVEYDVRRIARSSGLAIPDMKDIG